jgi:hypothetical protein
MLSAEAARLAALEVLCPAAALAGDEPFPTIAGARVFDSRAAAIQDLDPNAAFTPVLALYTADSSTVARGDAAALDDTDARTVLEVVAELAVGATDDDGTPFADALPGKDWEARLTLAALCAQVRAMLSTDERGWLFRRFVRQVNRITEETFAIPEIGARWHRVTMRFDLSIDDDDFTAGGMPEPARSLAALLPSGSAARAHLDYLADQFTVPERTPLAAIAFTEADGLDGVVVDTDPT